MKTDEYLFLKLNQALSGDFATEVFIILTRLGDGLVLTVLILPLFFLINRRRFYRHALPMIMAVALSGLVVNLMKIAVDRPRPPEHFAAADIEVHAPLGSPGDRSFPSGHTQTAFGAATYLACLHPPSSGVYLALAALVGLSRVALGVHFPLDVAVGAVIGAGFSLLAFWVARRRA